MESLRQLGKVQARVLRGGKDLEIPAQELVPGSWTFAQAVDGSVWNFGETEEARTLRLVPFLQAAGLLAIALTGFVVIRYQRRAEGEKAWTAMARQWA